MAKIDFFLPGDEAPPLLASFLEPITSALAREYLSAYVEDRGRVLDPFCQGPALIQEAGEREIICSHFSPVHYLVSHSLLHLPSPQDLDAATTQLGDVLKLEIPLRDQIRNLYSSRCSRCRESVVAEAFLWESGVVKSKEYACANCGFQGITPREDIDQEAALATEPRGFPYLYLLERIAPPGDEDRRLIRSLLDLYTPRSLSALVDLGLKIDSLFADSPLEESMRTLFLLTLSNTHKLAGHGLPRFPPARFRPPLEFVEKNVWSVFENVYRTVRELAETARPRVPGLVTQEATRSLAHRLEKESVDLILTVPPFPNRFRWAVYYFWAAWIWGRDRAGVLKPLLRVRPGDWAWYRRALATALRTLTPSLKQSATLIFLLKDGNREWAESLILAGSEAGLKLENIVYQPQTEPETEQASPRPGQREEPGRGTYRLTFMQQEVTMAMGYTVADRLREKGIAAMENLPREWGEALPSAHLRLAVWEAWGKEDLIRQAIKEGIAAMDLDKTVDQMREEGLLQKTFAPWPYPEESTGLFWLGSIYDEGKLPLLDRVEESAIRLLAESSPLSFHEAQKKVYTQFPGLLTPPHGLVEAALSAYAVERDGVMHRAEDPSRAKSEVLGDVEKAGARLGFQIMRSIKPGFIDLVWGEDGKPAYYFTYRPSAFLYEFYRLVEEVEKGARVLIVIPEAIGELLQLKLAWSPVLRSRLTGAGWDFVKAEHLKTVVQQEGMDRHELLKFIGLRPPIESSEAQLPLFL